jgi:hypothetical protein
MKIWRALKYALGLRLYRDLISLLGHSVKPQPDILFVAGSQVDLQWVLPAYEQAVRRGLRCAFAGPDLILPVGYSYVDITLHLLRFVRARIMLTATSGLTPNLMLRGSVRKVAVPHSLVSLHMVYPAGTFDGYTDVFCCGEHHYAEIEAMNLHEGVTGRRPVLIGYGKSELLATTRPADILRSEGQKHVLIGPSWGKGNILETMGEPLLARLLADGYRVTLRPHPSFFIFGDTVITSLVNAYRDHAMLTLENSMEESRALWDADIMIADYSGFAMEFAFIRELPVLYVDVPPKVLNPGWTELGPMPLELSVRERIGLVVPASVDEVVAALRRLSLDPVQWGKQIREERQRDWVNFGRFSEVCADELCRILGECR